MESGVESPVWYKKADIKEELYSWVTTALEKSNLELSGNMIRTATLMALAYLAGYSISQGLTGITSALVSMFVIYKSWYLSRSKLATTQKRMKDLEDLILRKDRTSHLHIQKLEENISNLETSKNKLKAWNRICRDLLPCNKCQAKQTEEHKKEIKEANEKLSEEIQRHRDGKMTKEEIEIERQQLNMYKLYP